MGDTMADNSYMWEGLTTGIGDAMTQILAERNRRRDLENQRAYNEQQYQTRRGELRQDREDERLAAETRGKLAIKEGMGAVGKLTAPVEMAGAYNRDTQQPMAGAANLQFPVTRQEMQSRMPGITEDLSPDAFNVFNQARAGIKTDREWTLEGMEADLKWEEDKARILHTQAETKALGQPKPGTNTGVADIDPSDYTTESWAKYRESHNLADLVRYNKPGSRGLSDEISVVNMEMQVDTLQEQMDVLNAIPIKKQTPADRAKMNRLISNRDKAQGFLDRLRAGGASGGEPGGPGGETLNELPEGAEFQFEKDGVKYYSDPDDPESLLEVRE